MGVAVAGVDFASSGRKAGTSPGQGALPSQAALTPAPTPTHSHHTRTGTIFLMIHLMCTLFWCVRKQSNWRKPTYTGRAWKFQVDSALAGNWFFFSSHQCSNKWHGMKQHYLKTCCVYVFEYMYIHLVYVASI